MTGNDLLADLSNLKETEIIRFNRQGDTLSLQVVFDNEEDIALNGQSEEEDDEDILNGHLYTLIFQGVKDFKTEGEEADNYTIQKIAAEKEKLSLSLLGHNRDGDDTYLLLSFSFTSYSLVDEGRIKGPDV